ncbi:MAG: D-alanyl-D-alanine carboxypeptidase/D-alanyl-D-alanine-endopeptidase [Candidatus Velthaea sp.]|jgi:D-alanyl-D-alanine carboxypeptidase/D-alanyl-D-alanine-endopeptidase (penicillin-binding protein 4)
MRRIALVAALFAVGLHACGSDTQQTAGSANAAAMPQATGLGTAPKAPAWSAASLREMQNRLAAALDEPTLRTSGIAIVDANARPLFLRRESRPYTPASTFKVLAAVSALQTFGPKYRFVTEIRSLDNPADGVVSGDLWLVGSGDPTLTSDDLRAGAGSVYRSGLRRVDGALVADASAFGGPEVNPAWEPDDLQYDYAAGTSALSVDQGTVEFHLVPTSPGAPARIDVHPPGDAVHTVGSIITAYSTELSIERAPSQNQFTFSGRVAVGAEQSFFRPVAEMPVYAGRVERAMLAARGVHVRDGVRVGVAPLGGHVLWRHRSQPLAAIVRDMLFTSNNHFAEQLLRAVGAESGVGTERSGGAVERSLFARDGVPQSGLRIVDGSGLAPTDRIAPISIATLLARTAAQPVGTTLVSALPRVGMEGTVRHRQITDALGRARAKSGHIENVNALVGFVQTRSHGRVAFAFMVNDPRADDGPVDAGIDRALDVLASE